jgi:ankyrin repeat protein
MTYRGAQNLIKRGDEAGLREALEHGLDPNLVNQNGWSLLMLAAVEGAVPLGRLLVEHGAKVDARNNKDQTASSLASDRGFPLFVELLRN